MNFSWVPFYRELAGRVLEFENRQEELLAILREMRDEGLPCVPLQDNQPDDSQKPLAVMDPFTFLANLARVETASATRLCSWFKQKWGLGADLPTDFEGRTDIQPRSGNSWFFGSVKSGRQPEDVGRMWTLARQALEANIGAVDFELLQTCMNQNNVGFYKLTKGLSWFSPQGFLPLNDTMVAFLKGEGVQLDRAAIKRGDANEYFKALEGAGKLGADYVSLVAKARNTRPDDIEEEDEENERIMPLNKPNLPLNQILYGPPGTGKTYTVVRRAVELIEPEFSGDFQARFEELRAQGQISFVTFHQSFSYEEFIEGLRPVLDDEGGGVSYEIRDGILKTMALAALNKAVAFQGGFDLAWENFCRNIAEQKQLIIENSDVRFRINLIGQDIEGEKLDGRRNQIKPLCEKGIARVVWDATLDKRFIDKLDVKKHASRTGVPADFMVAVINEICKEVFDRPTSAARRFLDGDDNFVPSDEPVDRFVLIVDEINRGNISKILGELITLLEDDKRLGAANELRLTLPVSGETFALPPNLHLLGTMNTADKSLASLDVALRRRFEFEELPPRPELCDGLALLPDVLRELNARLEWALDREHRLGHAYFLDVADENAFNERFRSKVVPLLIEYFPHDFKTLRAVLGEESDGFLRAFPAPSGFRGPDKSRWWFETGDDPTFSAFARLKKNFNLA